MLEKRTIFRILFLGALDEALWGWLIRGVILGALSSIWGYASELPGVVIALIGFWTLIGVVALLAILKRSFGRGNKQVSLNTVERPIGAMEAYASREEIGVFKKRVDSSVEVWALWHTAQATFNSELFASRRIKRLILPNPDNPEVATLAEMTTIPVETMRRQIREVSREVYHFGTEVKWWSGHITNAITLGNPEHGETWGVIEAFLPHVPRDKRPRIEFSKANQPDMCDSIRLLLNDMWYDRKRTFDPNA